MFYRKPGARAYLKQMDQGAVIHKTPIGRALLEYRFFLQNSIFGVDESWFQGGYFLDKSSPYSILRSKL